MGALLWVQVHRELTTVSEVKRNCMRVTDCGKEGVSVSHEPMDKTATLELRHGPDSYGRQQWGILRNGRKPDAATPRGG